MIPVLLAAVVGTALRRWYPFPADNVLLHLVHLERPGIYTAFRIAYSVALYSTPLILFSWAANLGRFLNWERRSGKFHSLAPYPAPEKRNDLYLVLGEYHKGREKGPAERPQWLSIPDRGLCTGIAVFGAIGSGKTSCCMYPYAEQILAYQARDRERKIGALILEVKGSFCHQVREILTRHGRLADYREISLGAACRYNPWHNDLEPYALAFALGSLLNNLFGKSHEAFWQQAYTELVMWLIQLHRTVYDYVTLYDVYLCIVSPQMLVDRIKHGSDKFRPQPNSVTVESECILIEPKDYLTLELLLSAYAFEFDPEVHRFRCAFSEDLAGLLKDTGMAYDTEQKQVAVTPTVDAKKKARFEAVERWYAGWNKMDVKLKTSIIQGVKVFLSLFDCDEELRASFCPPKECYDADLNRDGKYGVPVPPFSDLIEQGAVCAFNFPMAGNPGLARAIGAFLKLDFQRAMMLRIPEMSKQPKKHWRHMMFLCDEYHAFATVGESDPSGDEKFFALSREAKCIPLVATQSISSLKSTLGPAWETLAACFRTKIYLTLNDETSATAASHLCGKELQIRTSRTVSESGQDTTISMTAGGATAMKASVGTSKAYAEQMQPIFETTAFSSLGNAQAIVQAFDGRKPLEPSYIYLKPYYLDLNKTYFEQLAAGLI